MMGGVETWEESPRWLMRPRVTEVRCKTALNRVRGMPFTWSLNPYRGCAHACSYCYARTTHAFLGLDVGEDFSAQLFAKTNVAEVLRGELARRGWRRETVALGTSTDPYQPVEGRYRLTRRCLEALAEARTPAHVTTKGTLVVRDVGVLRELARVAGPGASGARVGVSVSLITLDDRVWRALEPGAPPPAQRLRALRRLADAGVPCGLAVAPVLPGLTDSHAALEALVAAAAEHGAQWVWAGAIHLEPAVRDHFLACLARHVPDAAAPYERVFGPAGGLEGARYAPKAYAERLATTIGELKEWYGLTRRSRPPRGPESSPPAVPAVPAVPTRRGAPVQMTLPL
jgi:DNA repair photolyase